MTYPIPPVLLLAALLPVGGPRMTPPLPVHGDTAWAPSAPAVAEMTVEIWPEYDDPRVLVIYRGHLAPSESTPTGFSLVAPAGAQIHMAGGTDANGGHIHGLYQTHDRGDGLMDVSYDLDVPDFYMELYYDPFTEGDERNFTYSVVSPYDVTSLVVTVQEPLRAKSFSVSPFTAEVVRDDRGLNYHVIRLDGVRAGTSEAITVSYSKTDRQPSVVPRELEGESGPPGRRAMSDILLGVAVLLAGITAYVYSFGSWRRDPRDRTANDPPHPGDGSQARSRRFCTKCGNPLEPDDGYCGACGHAVRAAAGNGARSPRHTPEFPGPSLNPVYHPPEGPARDRSKHRRRHRRRKGHHGSRNHHG